ncbi:uncharacterized protein LOC132953154 [Metopolophium dirhodum]|uniref:uncharacterized protein LOC132953154 n=1 Tax=Metopolophium dirhodum TaxID=44670 RepID=UPI00298F43D7|nr:uncharacterized protein LOC132953154 [Metopolophium dirhodum]
MIKVIQINLNHCWTAQQLLMQTISERGIDVTIISDYYKEIGDDQQWASSADSKCAIYIPTRSAASISDRGSGNGFAWTKVVRILYYSCYITPNCTLQEFDQFLVGLEASIRGQSGPEADLIVAGHFNSHSAEWGSTTADARGALLSDFASALGLDVCNEGLTPTYRRVNAALVIDVTFARPLQGRRHLVHDWSVLADQHTASDHDYIEFTVTQSGTPRPRTSTRSTQSHGWSVKKLSIEKIQEHWNQASLPHFHDNATAKEHAERLTGYLETACNAAMPHRTKFDNKKSVHWWSEEIAALRRSAIAARRRYQRAGRRAGMEGRGDAFEEYNNARKTLRLTIRRAQETSWRELCKSVDDDP